MSSETLPKIEHDENLSGIYGKIQVFLVVLAFAGLQLLLTLHLRMNALPVAEPAPEKIEAYNPELFKVMSFGQTPAVIDWMWIKVLEDPLLTHVKKGTHPAIFYSLDLITSLDPAYMEAYTAGATLVSVIRNDGPGALHLLLKAEDFRKTKLITESAEFRELYWSREWQVPFLLAYVDLFDMDDLPHATEAYREAATMPGAPEYLKVLVQQLATPAGQYQVGLRLLKFMAAVTHEPAVREKLRERFQSLQVDFFLFTLNDRLSGFLGSHPLSKERLSDPAKREKIWGKFLRASGIPASDPWGGSLSLGEDGQVVTTTPHRRVFGLK